MNNEEVNILKTVADDLKYLVNEWDQEIDDSSLSRCSAVLRRLLVEDGFAKAWNAMGLNKQPKVRTYNYEELMLDGESVDKITLAIAGGAKYRGSIIHGFRVLNYAKENDGANKAEKQLPSTLTMSLSQYINSICIIIDGASITRGELIRYLSDKLDGECAVTDPCAENGNDNKFCKLDQFFNNLSSTDKCGLYYELLCTGQCLAKTRDTAKLIKRAKELQLA